RRPPERSKRTGGGPGILRTKRPPLVRNAGDAPQRVLLGWRYALAGELPNEGTLERVDWLVVRELFLKELEPLALGHEFTEPLRLVAHQRHQLGGDTAAEHGGGHEKELSARLGGDQSPFHL